MLFAASACMFILGVLVGRNTAPIHFDMVSLDEKLARLQQSVLASGRQNPGGQARIPDEISFEFYDKLKEKTEIDEHAAGRPRVLAPKYAKPTDPELRVKTGGAEPGASEQAGSGPAGSERGPGPAGTLYAIQVASLRDPEKAEQVRDKFRAKGYPAYTQVAVVEGKGRWCRVRLGPYADRGQAKDDLARLQKAGVDAMLFLAD